MTETKGKVVGINGNMVSVQFDGNISMNEVAYVNVEGTKLRGEVIRIRGDVAQLQIFEMTQGIKAGDVVEFTGNLLSALLGPGLLGQVYDGLQNPLPLVAEKAGFFLERGVYVDALNKETKWEWTPSVKPGDTVQRGDSIGSVPEGPFTHKILVPFGLLGTYTVKEVTPAGSYTITEKMLKYFINKICGKYIFAPRIMICVPSRATEVEKKAVIDAATQAGARKVYLIEEPIAAAIGAGLDISKPCGNMVVDIGGGTTDIAVISLGGSVVSSSIKVAGDKFDEAIVKYIKKKYNIVIGERTAEDLKINIGCVYPKIQDMEMDIRGRDLATGLPKTITVRSSEMLEALIEPAMMVVDAVHSVLEKTPPELSADISDRGIYMTGGGCLIDGLDKLLQEKTGINVMIAQDAVSCVALGTGKALDNLDALDGKRRK